MKPSRILLFTLIIVLFYSTQAWSNNELPVPKFEMDQQNITHSGHVKIVWKWMHDQEVSFILQQADTANFSNAEIIYKGPDRASFVSGLPNGNYYFRLRAINSADEMASSWSKPVVVKVRHHSLFLALTLAGVGAFVFVITTAVVIKGSYQKETKA